MAAHSVFGGSSAFRWKNCRGSTAFLAPLPPQADSPYAQDGTNAHRLGEWCLTDGERNASLHVGTEFATDKGNTFTVTKAMATAVQVYLDAVYEELDASKDSELYVEQSFELNVAEPGEVFGSNDAMVYTPSRKRLVVFDYKHGVGAVDVEDNDQLKFYAAGALLNNPWPIAELELVIVQPNERGLSDDEDGVKRWKMDTVEVVEFVAEITDAIAKAKATKHGEGLKAGPWCRKTFCEGQTTCPARQNDVLTTLALDFKDITLVTPADLPDPSTMSGERIAAILRAASTLTAWVNQVEAFAFSQAQAGVKIPGKKLVDKVGRAKWIADEQKVQDYFVVQHGVDPDEVCPRSLVTITEAERLLKAAVGPKAYKDAKEDMRLRFTLKDSSGLTLVDESDKRDSVDPAAAFSAVNIPDAN